MKLGANPYSVNHKHQVPWECVTDESVLPVFQICVMCKSPGIQVCKHCKVVYYCSLECQKKDYTSHQKTLCQFFKIRDDQKSQRYSVTAAYQRYLTKMFTKGEEDLLFGHSRNHSGTGGQILNHRKHASMAVKNVSDQLMIE